ncbi:MAG: hypothetical protein ACI91F_001048 [Candidatus Binatia bacterium]
MTSVDSLKTTANAPSGGPSSGTAIPMNPEGLRSFFDKVGYRTLTSTSATWYQAGPRFLLSLPSHRAVSVPADEAQELLHRHRLAGIRYISDERDGGHESFQIVASGADYGLEKLSGNSRSRIRRGLKRNEVRKTCGAEVVERAESAFRQTLERQGRYSDSAITTWRRLMAAADDEPGIEIWSAWHEGELASYLMVMFLDDVVEFYQARSRNDLLKHYPNNALVFSLAEEMLVRRGVREITFGIESPEDVAELDTFKYALGFEKKPILQKVIFHPMLRTALAIPGARQLLNAAATREGAHVALRKASGLARFTDTSGQR